MNLVNDEKIFTQSVFSLEFAEKREFVFANFISLLCKTYHTQNHRGRLFKIKLFDEIVK